MRFCSCKCSSLMRFRSSISGISGDMPFRERSRCTLYCSILRQNKYRMETIILHKKILPKNLCIFYYSLVATRIFFARNHYHSDICRTFSVPFVGHARNRILRKIHTNEHGEIYVFTFQQGSFFSSCRSLEVILIQKEILRVCPCYALCVLLVLPSPNWDSEFIS